MYHVTFSKVAECSFAQTAQFAVSVYSRVIQRMQAWLGEPPILTTVSPVYVKIKN